MGAVGAPWGPMEADFRAFLYIYIYMIPLFPDTTKHDFPDVA